jgi:hypothetical protein
VTVNSDGSFREDVLFAPQQEYAWTQHSDAPDGIYLVPPLGTTVIVEVDCVMPYILPN